MGKERDLEKACLYQVERDFSLKGGGGTCGREFFFYGGGGKPVHSTVQVSSLLVFVPEIVIVII